MSPQQYRVCLEWSAHVARVAYTPYVVTTICISTLKRLNVAWLATGYKPCP